MEEIKKTERHLKLLSNTFLFRGIAPGVVAEVFRSPECVCLRFEFNEAVYTRESYRKSLGLVVSGRLKAAKTLPNGASVVMNTLAAGCAFGVAGLFHETEHYVSEVTAMRRSDVLFLPQELLRRLFCREPETAVNYIAFLSDRICFLNKCIDHYTGGFARDRLFAYLSSLPACADDPHTVELPCSMTRIADSLDIGRASLYRAMEKLICDGCVERSGKRIVLHPREN